MAESKEYRKIKKLYGEKFAKLCRELFPQILEEEGKLLEILNKKFDNNCNHFLGGDIIEEGLIEEFKNCIFEQYEKKEEEKIDDTRTPYEILDEAGYNLYECQTEEDIQSFEKYYARGGYLGPKGEILCTIYLGGRLNRCYCFWAVKKNVDEINRNDFKNPNKSDDYSTSVLAIQFDKSTGRPEIISRYNHSVPNPNCTLGNNLDNLAPGLEQSFANLLKERGLELNSPKGQKMELPGYTVANNGKYYKYNYEINGVYYCPGNIVIEGGEPKTIISPEKGILADYFCIDIQNKTITVCNGIKDSFIQDLQDIEKIDVIKSDREDEEKIIKIFKSKTEEPIIIGINRYNQIIRYENANVRKIEGNFLFYNEGLRTLELPNLEEVGENFLYFNEGLTMLELPNLKRAGGRFLRFNEDLTILELPDLEKVGDDFLRLNEGLRRLELPNLEEVGENFLYFNEDLTMLELPNLKRAGECFLYWNAGLRILKLPNLKQVGCGFLHHNKGLTILEVPNLEQAELDKLENEQKKLQEMLKEAEKLESQVDKQIQQKDKNDAEDKE